MPNSKFKIRQFHHESDTWKRNLEFITQENANLKNRLAEVLQSIPADGDILNTAEYYQNEFIREDELVNFLRRDISKLDKLLVQEVYEDGEIFQNVIHQQKKLSEDMKGIISGFNRLKFDFNNYLGNIL